MSGGYFDYKQYQIADMANKIENVIKNNAEKDEWGYARNYCPETIEKFNEAVKALRQAAIYVQRIDWLLSGDDSEESFISRLADDLTSPTLTKE